MMKRLTKDKFRPEDFLVELLLAVRRGEKSDVEVTKDLREYILSVGSSTPDNVNCAKNLEIGRVKRPLGATGGNRGVKVRGRRVLLSDVFHVAECISIPEEVREEFPALSNSQWKACMRLATLLFALLEEDEYLKQS